MNETNFSVLIVFDNQLNIARVRNCPDIAILNSLFGLGLFVFFVLVVFFFLSFLSFYLFVFLSGHHADQMSEGSEV